MATSNEAFDPHDESSWYHVRMNRQDATDLLMKEREAGVFLVRDSATIAGDLVLCVREDNRVSHYIINKLQRGEKTVFKIGDQEFDDIPALLSFYRLHYLDTTPLIRPASKHFKVVAKFDFDGKDEEDLPFRKGDILTVIREDEEGWWTARNREGREGSIPVPYVQRRTLPAYARVIKERVPNQYDKSALPLRIGDRIMVTRTNPNGEWEGEIDGRKGYFPFNYVEWEDVVD
ncbi:unnamed protein product [Cyprideis torosa]|uniref:Uncharacterized protein n=1 Tax=Cyprideis torosa TaxID=163714 RepID=A0A7R8WF17_9CRUS|nr:unnamed protein product [Cyprideis torosa]CAG0890132.1 unnamed protein product [Cyprideis torosa]